MSKREASMFAAQGVVDIDAPRAKRHKPGPPPHAPSNSTGATSTAAGTHASSLSAATQVDGTTPNERTIKQEQIEAAPDVVLEEDIEAVKEKGLKLWQVVREAINKEGRIVSNDFLRLPSKRQYPDYYHQIKHPISLDEIKQRLETGVYRSFNECTTDFETCFRNAKRYNMSDSQIWKDAKFLHKFSLKEATKLSKGAGVDEVTGEDGAEAAASSDVEGETKKKQTAMTRLLKARLQKLVEKAEDGGGRILSTEFMELPSKKKWPVYYKAIKKPQCLENIFKRLKRKEYHTPSDFANDVELVFSNALEFNQEHTQIWEDATILRDHFRRLMSDLPAPFTIPAYASTDHPTTTKIRLRVPNAAFQQSQTAATSNPNPTGGTLMLRVPPQPSPAAFSTMSQLPNSNDISVNVKKSPTVIPKVTLAVPDPPSTITSPPVPSHRIPPQPLLPLTTPVAPPAVPAVLQLAVTVTPPLSQPTQLATFPPSNYPNPLYPQSQPLTTTPTRPPVTATVAAATGATTLPNTNTIHLQARPTSHPLVPVPVTTPNLPKATAAAAVPTQVLTLAPPGVTIASATEPIAPRPPPAGATATAVAAATTSVPPINTSVLATSAPLTATPAATPHHLPSKSPTPATTVQRRLQYALVTTKPLGRRLELRDEDGVKTWAVRLGADEWSVCVSGVQHFPLEIEPAVENGDGGSDMLAALATAAVTGIGSGVGNGTESVGNAGSSTAVAREDGGGDKMDVDTEVNPSVDARKEEEEEPEEEEQPPQPVKETPVKRGKGRPPKKRGPKYAAAKAAAAATAPEVPAVPPPVPTPPPTIAKGKVSAAVAKALGPPAPQVKLNGVLLRSHPDRKGEWETKLPVGYNVVEIGEKGGMIWRIYLERMGVTVGARLTE